MRVAIVSALLLSACGHSAPPPTAASDKLGQPVSFSLPSDEGALVAVPLPGARATVLDFFGPTCEPCKKALPELCSKRAELETHGAKLVLVAVLADAESSDDAKHALISWGVTSQFLVDSQGTGRREAGVMALPATMVIDSVGIVKWVAPVSASAAAIVAAAE